MNLNIWCTWGEGEGGGGEKEKEGGQMNILNYETNKLNNVYYKGEKYIVILWGEYQK